MPAARGARLRWLTAYHEMLALERIGASSCAVESPLISLTVRWVALKSRTHRPRRAVKCARGPASPCPPVIRGAPHRVVQRHRHGCTSSCWLAKLVRSGKASSMTQHRRCSRFVSARALAEAHRSGIPRRKRPPPRLATAARLRNRTCAKPSVDRRWSSRQRLHSASQRFSLSFWIGSDGSCLIDGRMYTNRGRRDCRARA